MIRLIIIWFENYCFLNLIAGSIVILLFSKYCDHKLIIFINIQYSFEIFLINSFRMSTLLFIKTKTDTPRGEPISPEPYVRIDPKLTQVAWILTNDFGKVIEEFVLKISKLNEFELIKIFSESKTKKM